jgi:RNA ligase
MDKLDGWLGVLYRHEGKFKVSTRGSFHSSGSQWATEEIQKYDLGCLPDEATLCFEILTPEQRIILNYGEERKLVILAGFNRLTGDEYPRDDVAYWARQIGLPIVHVHPLMSLEELRKKQKELEKVEGYVIRFPDGRRVKIKTEWYVELSRIMANLTPIVVWEAIKGGKVDQAFLVKVPEELRRLAENYIARLEEQYARVKERVEVIVRPVLARLGDDRAALGRYSQEHAADLGVARSALFLVRDGKHAKLDTMIKELIYPSGNHFLDESKLFPER